MSQLKNLFVTGDAADAELRELMGGDGDDDMDEGMLGVRMACPVSRLRCSVPSYACSNMLEFSVPFSQKGTCLLVGHWKSYGVR